jgi:hypothetical protein
MRKKDCCGLAKSIDSYIEPVSVRAHTWYSLETSLGRFAIWSGPILKQRWLNNRLVHTISSLGREQGFGFQAHIGSRNSHRGFSVVFVFMRCLLPLGSLSIRCNISFPVVVKASADIFEFVRRGNLEAVRSMFSLRKATPLNTSPDGTGLLHVRYTHDPDNIVSGSKLTLIYRLLFNVVPLKWLDSYFRRVQMSIRGMKRACKITFSQMPPSLADDY